MSKRAGDCVVSARVDTCLDEAIHERAVVGFEGGGEVERRWIGAEAEQEVDHAMVAGAHCRRQAFEVVPIGIVSVGQKQSGEAFEGSQKYLRWQDRAANQKFFAGEHAAFRKEAADLLLEAGIIKQIPDMTKLADTQFIK